MMSCLYKDQYSFDNLAVPLALNGIRRIKRYNLYHTRIRPISGAFPKCACAIIESATEMLVTSRLEMLVTLPWRQFLDVGATR